MSEAQGCMPQDMTTAPAIDLTRCDREPVAFPGAILPHGALLVLLEPDLVVLQASVNCPAMLGTPPAENILGRPLEVAIGALAGSELRRGLAQKDPHLKVRLCHVWFAVLNGEALLCA